MAGDPYVYPGTDVLRNKLGIRNADQLTVVETDLHDLRAAQLVERPIRGGYDLAHLQRFHRHLFGDVYDWAGQIRTVAIAKSEMFALPQFIESYANESLSRLADDEHLHGIDRDEFVGKVAGYLADVNAAHPFRDGNGRTQRAFFGQLAHEAGWEIAWGALTPSATSKRRSPRSAATSGPSASSSAKRPPNSPATSIGTATAPPSTCSTTTSALTSKPGSTGRFSGFCLVRGEE